MLSSIIIAAATAVFFSVLPATALEVTDCSCGFQDERTASFYTDSIVLYFNETDSIDPAAFLAQDFSHKKEQGWNSLFKIGAKADNARITNTTDNGASVQALEMVLDAADDDHLVVGAHLQSARRDIQYGVFEAAMKPAGQWTGGTVLSFGVNFNRSQGAEIDFMNSDRPSTAQVANLINGEWPSSDRVTNFTTMEAAGVQPWTSFTDVRFSWNKTAVAFDVANNMTRLATKKSDLPAAGQALVIKTWSTGDSTFGDGPPLRNATHGDVLYVRTFFNSTEMTQAQHNAYDERCVALPRCMTADTSLRGFTAYDAASQLKWKEPPKNKGIRTLAGIVAACCSSFGVFALVNVFLRRTPWKKLWPRRAHVAELPQEHEPKSPATADSFTSSDRSVNEKSEDKDHGTTTRSTTPAPAYGSQTPQHGSQTPAHGSTTPQHGSTTPRSGSHTPAPSYHSAAPSIAYGSDQTDAFPMPSVIYTHTLGMSRLEKALDRISEMSHIGKSDVEGLKHLKTADHGLEHPDQITPVTPSSSNFSDEGALPKYHYPEIVVTDEKEAHSEVKLAEDSKASADATVAPAPVMKQPKTVRVDYLSGLTSLACIGVTLHHFGQTFWPFVIEGYGLSAHYPETEKWLHIFVGGIILSNLWIGPFFLTATRFLSTNYLKHGNLEDIAKKELRRAPRLFVPIIIISLLQYFLISMGLTASLQWLPSVTFSNWPYVVIQPNFAVWMNNIVELAYLIPNAVPEINAHYCIGVLWTIPVQLQYTYVVLAATVVIRDIRTPWKRFGLYTFVILAGWYARSWSACHWMGLVLSDLEATYQWRKYLQKRPFAHYLILTSALTCALGATLFSVFNQKWSFNIAEKNIHPDQLTGKPIMATEGRADYPSYQEPTLAILLFSIGLQITVELSSWVQSFLSMRFFVFLNPMIFTIYLTHGFVMWTWGAWVSLACNGAGMPYWANLIVTLVTTYIMIFLLAWILTPLLEFPTLALMRNLDRWTKEEPRAKRPTTAPFSKDIVLNRSGEESAANGSA